MVDGTSYPRAFTRSQPLSTGGAKKEHDMREYGLSFLASNDADFERVRDITVFKPTDLP